MPSADLDPFEGNVMTDPPLASCVQELLSSNSRSLNDRGRSVFIWFFSSQIMGEIHGQAFEASPVVCVSYHRDFFCPHPGCVRMCDVRMGTLQWLL